MKLGDAGKEPAVGRALIHHWATAAGLSIRSNTTIGSEVVL